MPDMQADGVTGWSDRIRSGVVVALLLAVAPGLVTALVAGPLAATGFLLGAPVAAASCLASGIPATRRVAPVFVAGVALGAITTGSWWWVAVLGALAGLAGLTSTRSPMGPMLLATLLAVVTPASADAGQTLVLAAFAALGVAYALALVGRTGMADDVSPTLPSWNPALVGGVLASTVGAAGALAVLLDHRRAVWIPMTVVVLAAPSALTVAARGRERLIGTLAGAGAATVVGMVAPPRPVHLGLAFVALVLLVATQSMAPRVQAACMSALVLLVGGPPAAVFDDAGRRIVFTVLGAAILLVGVALARLLERSRRQSAGSGSVRTSGRRRRAPRGRR